MTLSNIIVISFFIMLGSALSQDNPISTACAIIDEVTFENVELGDVLVHLRNVASEGNPNAELKGVVYAKPAYRFAKISLNVRKIPLGHLLRLLGRLTSSSISICENVILVEDPMTEQVCLDLRGPLAEKLKIVAGLDETSIEAALATVGILRGVESVRQSPQGDMIVIELKRADADLFASIVFLYDYGFTIVK